MSLAVAVPLAVACGLSGLLLDQWAQHSLREVGTTVHPAGSTSAIVCTGAFAYSRNPIYLAQGLLLACVGFAMHRPLFFFALVPWYAIIRYGVVSREEQYLTLVFGQQYLDYTAKVRRWL